MPEIHDHIVDFTFCNTCIHKDEDESCDICNDCLNEPSNVDSRRPVNYVEAPQIISREKRQFSKKEQ